MAFPFIRWGKRRIQPFSPMPSADPGTEARLKGTSSISGCDSKRKFTLSSSSSLEKVQVE